ncbi:unnamed protein product [Orchesella dallaii]|uniref:Uncharacterized protein n=1 Tax=Orchesella dallaii TaxID=48710 RepID=A0ABP1Q5E5_9HEXA
MHSTRTRIAMDKDEQIAMASTSLGVESEAGQTDVESLDGTSLNNSSVTQYANSSETEYDNDDIEVALSDLVESQFPSEAKRGRTGKDVQEWLENANDETQDISKTPSLSSSDWIHSEKIEKMGAALLDGIKNENNFSHEDWLQVDDIQEVPSVDPVSNFLEDVKKRLSLALMYVIKNVTSTPATVFRHLYTAVLHYAAEEVTGPNSCPSQSEFLKNCDFKSLTRLRTLNGGYFSELRLSFRKCPKQKLKIVRAVEQFVNHSIDMAYDTENPVLFTRYAEIPKIVHDCNEEKGLGYNTDQLVKYAIRLQKAVHLDMIGRCLDFLAVSGFKLKQEYVERAGSYLSSTDSALGKHVFSVSYAESYLSSQGSSSTQNDLNSQNFIDDENSAPQEMQLEQELLALEALQNSPDFVEALQEQMRGNMNNDSPGGSWNSQGSISLPQFSLPLREQPEVAVVAPMDEDSEQDSGWLLYNEGEFSHINLNMSLSYNLDNLQSDSSDDEGPLRRRPRLELQQEDEYVHL